jgi:hypothetical protein
MDAFEEYRKAHDELDADPVVAALWDGVVAAQKLHAEATAPYQDRMRVAEEVIRGMVLEEGHSVTLHGVEARYTKGRASTSWKSVAEAVGAPAEVIAKHTKEGDPSVSVRVVE